MEIQQTGMFSNKKAQDKFDKWSKEDIYEAYLVENQARVALNKEVNRLSRKIAEIRHAAKID